MRKFLWMWFVTKEDMDKWDEQRKEITESKDRIIERLSNEVKNPFRVNLFALRRAIQFLEGKYSRKDMIILCGRENLAWLLSLIAPFPESITYAGQKMDAPFFEGVQIVTEDYHSGIIVTVKPEVLEDNIPRRKRK